NVLHSLKRLLRFEVAIVPAGTCNDFARGLGLVHRRLDAALGHACTGRARLTDLGAMDDLLFLNNAGFGRRPHPAGRRMRPWRTLRHFQPTRLRAEWPKGSIDGDFYMVLVCNAPFFSGGLYFSRNSRLNDGYLDAYLVPRIPKWKLVPLLMIGRLGRPVRSRQMINLKVRELRVEAGSDLWPQADGEPAAGATRRVHFRVAAEQLRLIVPETSRSLMLYN
ncbi:MAG TPA: diacylglycerol kinase family protein, partial [Elusimicrobiota bacterium]|nr:diacylglycerol kinase family protein [Elusimicrobiota bacterium]